MELPLTFDAAFAGTLPWEELIARYQRLVYRTAWRMLGSQADAEDLSQEVFLRIHARLADFHAHENPTAYIYRVTVNLALDQIRRRRPNTPLETVELAAPSPLPDEQALRLQRLDLLARLLPRLSPGERASLVLRDLEGLSTREVAQILEVSEETVRTSIHRAKEKLRQWMT